MLVSLHRLKATTLTNFYTSLSTKLTIVHVRGASCFHRQYSAAAMPRVATKSKIKIAIEPAVAELGLQKVSVRQ